MVAGWMVFVLDIVLALAVVGLFSLGEPAGYAAGAVVIVLILATTPGFILNQPNQARALTILGHYAGTVLDDGWWWVNPLSIRRRVSRRIRNLDSDVLKVNDAVGNPVEIAAVVSWQVIDTARALFDVENYENFVALQTETSVRHVASTYPYDDYEDGQASLRANADEVIATLQAELRSRLEVAGVAVLDTRLRRLAYAPEIAGEMLRRHQANAVVAARKQIVVGAVGMVEHALEMLSERHVVELDEERKASIVSNLLVVLCSDRGAQPVVNSGSLYS